MPPTLVDPHFNDSCLHRRHDSVGNSIWPQPRATFWRGAGLGALIVATTQPLAWYLLFLLLYFSGESGSFPATTVHPLGGLLASFAYGALSLLFSGWITIPVGGAIGGALGYAAGKEWEKSDGS